MQHLNIRASRRYGTLSPLRYPGGKAALAGLFEDLISDIGLCRPIYVEPYAGGAGAGIALLRQGLLGGLVINDFDPAVHAFWRSMTQYNSDLVELVRSTPLTISEWKRQRAIYRDGDESDILKLGFAFLYLNRTNRSGVLRGGVIGGLDQQGRYKIDARFNRETLVDRILAVGSLSNQITVSDLDGRTVIRKHAQDPSVFMYIDPPYVQAGSRLYLNAFDAQDHRALARIVNEVDRAHWLMTYDVSPLIEKLYADHFQSRYELNYSARHPGFTEELIIASDAVANALTKRGTILEQEQ
ncbi:DNA adenine methylase [Austwickia chelonae]|uniref:site-specific DNA-methyltransferase (adenine-specific) n=1 Tax=Austwickia chelonae NBRC 105200 TaxID=1184607 RepID=K6VNT2_9MICO|nr:DNA adenine methylase [Austwickia chelonae]GAB77005.1 putative DNA methyltransferase [Austwickia chelonae NBRC 105200]SEW33202.1 DNA adenine methylase [Austwickia chelonae]